MISLFWPLLFLPSCSFPFITECCIIFNIIYHICSHITQRPPQPVAFNLQPVTCVPISRGHCVIVLFFLYWKSTELFNFNNFVFKWIDEGHLSVRMRIPGNIWLETWQTAKAVPVRRQKRLFDDTKEAEKVSGWFHNFLI